MPDLKGFLDDALGFAAELRLNSEESGANYIYPT